MVNTWCVPKCGEDGSGVGAFVQPCVCVCVCVCGVTVDTRKKHDRVKGHRVQGVRAHTHTCMCFVREGV